MGRDSLRFKPVPGNFVVGRDSRKRVKRLRLKSGKKRRSVELNYQDREMLGFSSGR